jgi:hypothetical protein
LRSSGIVPFSFSTKRRWKMNLNVHSPQRAFILKKMERPISSFPPEKHCGGQCPVLPKVKLKD